MTPHAEVANPIPVSRSTKTDSSPPIFIGQPVNTHAVPLHVTEEPAVAAESESAFNPAALTPDDIRAFVQKAIDGESWRKYKINTPPTDRPIRVYADGTLLQTFILS